MIARQIAGIEVSSLGLGCMNLSHAYGTPPSTEQAAAVLRGALELGIVHFDTAALYGFGRNEELVGAALGSQRHDVLLASKCGIGPDENGNRCLNGRPDFIRWSCDQSLKRLNVDMIDLFYLHRLDPNVPIEESTGALGDLVRQGKVRTIGLSEISAQTLRRAHKEFPVTAVQTEYSLWTRNPEVAVLEACSELGVAFVAFSPVARGFLTSTPPDMNNLGKGDLRAGMPRFQGEAWAANLELLEAFKSVARRTGCTPAQLSLAWVLAQADHIIPIPGTSKIDHLEENDEADQVELSAELLTELDQLINPRTVQGPRYAPAMQAAIDTEDVPLEA